MKFTFTSHIAPPTNGLIKLWNMSLKQVRKMEHHSLGQRCIHFKEFYSVLYSQEIENPNQTVHTLAVLFTITTSDLFGRIYVSVLATLGSADLKGPATPAETLLLVELAKVLLN